MDAANSLLTAAPAAPGASVTLLGVVILLLFCLLPALIAFSRKHVNAVPIALTGILFGWTLIGWGVALIWSFTSPAVVAAVPSYAGTASAPAAATNKKAVKLIGMTAAVLVVLVVLLMVFSKRPAQEQVRDQPAAPAVESGVPVPAEDLFGK